MLGKQASQITEQRKSKEQQVRKQQKLLSSLEDKYISDKLDFETYAKLKPAYAKSFHYFW